MQYLNRSASGLSDSLWEQIDKAAAAAARDVLTCRRFLAMDGPYGVGLTSVELGIDKITHVENQEASVVMGKAVSVPMLRRSCLLSIRRIQAHLNMGQPLDLSAVESAAEAVAKLEETLIYYGNSDFGMEGLMNAEGSETIEAGDWHELDEAVNDVLSAVNTLDQAGFHGPYALAMSSYLYNNLFRRYENTNMLQLEHLRRLCEGGLFKAPIEGAALVDPHAGLLVLGQDLMTGYTINDGVHYHLFAVESLVLKLQEPKAICTLKAKSG